MSNIPIRYPLADLILSLLKEANLTIPILAKSLELDSPGGIKIIEECIATGRAPIRLLNRLRKCPLVDESDVDEAIAASLHVFETEGHQYCDALEENERQEFRPHLLPIVEDERPTNRQLSSLWTAPSQSSIIYFPADFESYPEETKADAIQAAIRASRTRTSLRTEFGGRIVSYRYFPAYDGEWTDYSVDGDPLVEDE